MFDHCIVVKVGSVEIASLPCEHVIWKTSLCFVTKGRVVVVETKVQSIQVETKFNRFKSIVEKDRVERSRKTCTVEYSRLKFIFKENTSRPFITHQGR